MKKIAIAMFLILMTMTTTVFGATNLKMEIVEDNICTINLNEQSVLEKRLIESELEKHKLTLQLKVSNNSEIIIPSGELILVIDSSQSMEEKVSGETTRKDLVLASANKLVENLLGANSTSLKIGVVTFSTGSEKNEEGYLITGTMADAQKVCDLTNDLQILKDKITNIEGTGPYTNLDAGLQLAKEQFSAEDTNKYMIILTDGLPNLAVGYNDLISNEGLANVINQTKSTLKSLQGIEVITMLTGISNYEDATLRTEEADSYTYSQVVHEVFGSEKEPTIGKFYNIADSEIEQTITNEIYRDLLPVTKTLENITITDYIPQNIADNFKISLAEESKNLSATISEDQKTITWKVDKLNPNETKILKIDLILKTEFDEKIIGEILNTNEKIDTIYKDFDGEEKSKTSDITPKIKLTAQVKEDTTIATEIIPNAGAPASFGIVFIILLGLAIIFAYKK